MPLAKSSYTISVAYPERRKYWNGVIVIPFDMVLFPLRQTLSSKALNGHWFIVI